MSKIFNKKFLVLKEGNNVYSYWDDLDSAKEYASSFIEDNYEDDSFDSGIDGEEDYIESNILDFDTLSNYLNDITKSDNYAVIDSNDFVEPTLIDYLVSTNDSLKKQYNDDDNCIEGSLEDGYSVRYYDPIGNNWGKKYFAAPEATCDDDKVILDTGYATDDNTDGIIEIRFSDYLGENKNPSVFSKSRFIESAEKLEEATLSTQAMKMESTLIKIKTALSTMSNTIKEDTKAVEKDKTYLTTKVNGLLEKVDTNLKKLQDKGFKEWYNKIDSNSGIFGFKKSGSDSLSLSRRDLGL